MYATYNYITLFSIQFVHLWRWLDTSYPKSQESRSIGVFFRPAACTGGRSDSPNVKTFLHNAQAIRIQRTMAIGHGGNVRKRKEQWKTDIADLSRPLKKRARKTLHYDSD